MVVKFVAKTQYHQESECGRFMISRSNVGQEIVYTLTSKGKIIDAERCRDNATERVEAVNLLKEKACEYEV